MSPFRYLFPSFEKPIEREPYIRLERPPRRGKGVGIVLTASVLCAALLALPQIFGLSRSQSFDEPVPQKAALAEPAPAPSASAETYAVNADDPRFSAKLAASCGDKPTARRACAEAQAVKEALISGVFARADAAPPAATASINPPALREVLAANEETAPAGVAAPKPKTKTVRVRDDAPVERLVRVYDQVMPDGRRVPVYRRANGSLEVGAVSEGEYRPSRSAELTPPGGSGFFGFQ